MRSHSFVCQTRVGGSRTISRWKMDTRGYGIRNGPSSILSRVRMGSFEMAKSHVEMENGRVGLSGRKPL